MFEKVLSESLNKSDIAKGYWIRKIIGTDIYKFRVNRGDRILFKYLKDKEIIFLNYCNHDNQIRVGKLLDSKRTFNEIEIDTNAYNEDEFENKFLAIKNSIDKKTKFYIGSMISAGAFTLFFGGNGYDAFVAVLFSLLIYFIDDKIKKYCPNIMMFNFITAFIVGLGISVVSRFFGLNADKIVIGDIMLLIPGVAFTNSMRNLLVGDTLAGVMRLVETILWAAALAVGFVLSMMIVGV